MCRLRLIRRIAALADFLCGGSGAGALHFQSLYSSSFIIYVGWWCRTSTVLWMVTYLSGPFAPFPIKRLIFDVHSKALQFPAELVRRTARLWKSFPSPVFSMSRSRSSLSTGHWVAFYATWCSCETLPRNCFGVFFCCSYSLQSPVCI